MQRAARLFGKITARPKGNTDRVEGAGTGVGSTPAAGSMVGDLPRNGMWARGSWYKALEAGKEPRALVQIQ